MDSNENTAHTECYEETMEGLKEIKLGINNLIIENTELRARNKELKKENEKLHETILQMSQKK